MTRGWHAPHTSWQSISFSTPRPANIASDLHCAMVCMKVVYEHPPSIYPTKMDQRMQDWGVWRSIFKHHQFWGRPGASASQQWEVQLSARYRQWTPQEKRRLKSWKHYPCLSVAPLKCSSLFWGDLNYKRFQFMPKFDCKEGLSCLPQIGGKATHFKTLGVFTGHCTCTQTFWETRYLRRSAREIAWKTILLHCTLLIKFVQVQRSIQ